MAPASYLKMVSKVLQLQHLRGLSRQKVMLLLAAPVILLYLFFQGRQLAQHQVLRQTLGLENIGHADASPEYLRKLYIQEYDALGK